MIPLIKNANPTKKADWILVLLSHRSAQYLNKHLEWGHSFKPTFACLETVTSEQIDLLLLRKETGLKNLLSNETLLLELNKEKSQKQKAPIPYPISETQKDLCFIMADAPHTQHLPEIVGRSPVKASMQHRYFCHQYLLFTKKGNTQTLIGLASNQESI